MIRTLAAALSASTCIVAFATPAMAQTQQFNIPAGALKPALDAYANQSRRQVIYRGDEVRSARSPGANGVMSAEAALDALLAGTGFTVRTDSSGAIAIMKAGNAAAAVDNIASPAADKSSEGLADIVVTAEKRETSLQRTPIAIAVLGSEDLANRHVVSLANLGDGSIPSLRIAPARQRSSALTINIRGAGALSDTNQPAREQGAGVYIDGVYLGRAQGLGAALYDVERIEVLRGPQGTLFGRNTEGGAISMVTRKPSGEARLDLTAGVGNFGNRELIGHVDLPEFNNISLKVDALYEKRGGTMDNPLAGQPDFNAYKRYGTRVVALWRPSPDFSATYAFDISRDDTTPYNIQLFAPGSLPVAPVIDLQPDRASTAAIGVPMGYSVGKTQGHLLNLNWELNNNLQLRSISSYRDLDQSQLDNSAAVLAVFAPNATFSRYSIANLHQYQYSQEFQLIGKTDHLTYVGGLFYYHENVKDDAWTPDTLRFNADGTAYSVLPSPVARTPFPDRASTAETTSSALFGQATFTPEMMEERIHLTGGLRYSRERKSGSLTLVNGFIPTLNGVTGPISFHVRSNRVDPMVNLAFDLGPNAQVYGKWSTGSKAAGANARSPTYRTFGAESVSVFEIGAKTEFFDRRVRLNAAAYTGQYKDVQTDFNVLIPGSNRTTLETTNAEGNGRIKGVEVDLTVKPVNRLTLSGSYAYTYVRLPPAPNPLVASQPLVPVYPIYSPPHAASAAIDYELPLGDASLTAHLDANYAATQYTSANDPTKIDSSFLVNGRLTLGKIAMQGGNAEMQISLWSRNLLNEQHIALQNFSGSFGYYGFYNEPRTFGGEVRIKM